MSNIKEGITYDDILIRPTFSDVSSRKNVSLKTELTNKISLNLPIISSNMDTITEEKMAIQIAKMGGIGILHRYCSIDEQVKMVKKVKRYTNFIIEKPYTFDINNTMSELISFMREKHTGSIIITETYSSDTFKDKILKGIITKRDILYYENCCEKNETIDNIMTKYSDMITVEDSNLDDEYLLQILLKNRIENLPVIKNKENPILIGLVTLKDILYRSKYREISCLDKNKRLVVGAAVGVKDDYLLRTQKLIENGCDVICVDVAHGHHELCGNAVKEIRKLYPDISIIAGNVCTADGVKYLSDCGADSIKVGIGPGSICITRVQTGCGCPQLTAVLECSEQARKCGVSVIADGGHSGKIGNIFKALCSGASACMLGGMISGTDETPGEVIVKDNKKVKMIRGMAGRISNLRKTSKTGEKIDLSEMTPEGVEGYVSYKGPVKDVINQISGGIRSGFSYVGCHNFSDLRKKNIEFIKLTNASYKESGSHDISQI